MVAFYIVFLNKTVIFNSGLVQKVGGVGFLEQGIADVFLVSEYLVDGASVPPFSSCIGSWNEIFYWLPIEELIRRRQSEYSTLGGISS